MKIHRVRVKRAIGSLYVAGVAALLVWSAGGTVPLTGAGVGLGEVEFVVGGGAEVGGWVGAGYRHVALEWSETPAGPWVVLISGALTGARGELTFRLPAEATGEIGFFRVLAGTELSAPAAQYAGDEFLTIDYLEGGGLIGSGDGAAIHVVNRLGYGPNETVVSEIRALGESAYIESQLAPETIDEASNVALHAAMDALFYDFLPNDGDALVSEGDTARYFKGSVAPPLDWNLLAFDDSGWLEGPTGIGYGDGDDATVLDDMLRTATQAGYLTVYLRLSFQVADPGAIENLVLRAIYDDGIVAYLNGLEIARANVSGSPPAYNRAASRPGGSLETPDQDPYEFDVTRFANLLEPGENVLAIQVHNQSYTSTDLSIIPELLSVSDAPYQAVRGPEALQQLLHVRAALARRQLQAALGEFWENHFTTDFDKVEEYLLDLDAFEDLEDAGVSEAVIELQAETEAARMEWQEYEFFHENALGYFGDLLLYSATSPAMLIYLDNVLNVAGAPNENYAREILELHGFGAENRYVQADIEELARCFTGWSIRKMRPSQAPSFPDSARTPPTNDSVAVASRDIIVDLGETWNYFKGRVEPSPAGDGSATLAWTLAGFDDSAWLSGPTGIGARDGDDATELTDLSEYLSVYLRKEVTFPALDPGTSLVAEIDYDDGYVAYLNGVEIGRSSNMRNAGSPPAFSDPAGNSREAVGNADIISLEPLRHLLVPGGPNIFAIQAHNVAITNGDFSILPRIVALTYTDDSIEPADPTGIWTFRFRPGEHDTGPKELFAGTPHEMNIPAGRTGADGVLDAIDVIDAMSFHPSTAEFIVIKLVNRFVTDEISLDTYHDRTAPAWALETVDSGIAAWNSTARPGHIATVLTAILDPAGRRSGFWREGALFAKVKSPAEFIGSACRVLDAQITGSGLRGWNRDMGMEFVVRDDPDGWSELGPDWVDTLGLLERMRFCQTVSLNLAASTTTWDIDAWMVARGLVTAEDVIGYFNDFLFDGALPDLRLDVFRSFANTDTNGSPSPADSLAADARSTRFRELVSLILSTPEFQLQ